MKSRCFCFVVAAALAGCGGDDAEQKPATCETNCERQVAAKCRNTATDFVTTCKQGCGTTRQTVAVDCRDEVAAVYACAATKATYACNATGDVYVTNPQACAVEAAACANCGAGLACVGL